MKKKFHAYYKVRLLLLIWIGWSMLLGCQPTWEFSVEKPEGDSIAINQETIVALEKFSETVDGRKMIPLERLLVEAGHLLVDQIQVTDQDGSTQTYHWAAVASDSWLSADGKLSIQEQTFNPASIQVTPDESLAQVDASITDIAPTAALALGLGEMASATGQPLLKTQAKQVLLVFLDAFGYVRYQQALTDGLIPYLGSLEQPLLALTGYPPATVPSTASVLTGATSTVHGVDQRSIRKTETETLFDIAAQAGLDVRAVEGDALSFQLRNAQFVLSGDRNNDGSTNDEVLDNARAILLEGMPDIFWIHFHGIDDTGHSYGPGSEKEKVAIQQVDAAVEEIIGLAPSGTLVIIFADHGMHMVSNSERLGNHEHLIPEDMLIPIFILQK